MNTRPALAILLSQTARAARSPLSLCALTLALAACATNPSPTASAPAATTPVAAAPAPAAPTPVIAVPAPAPEPAPAPIAMTASIDFDKQVKPFFVEYCIHCHSGPDPASRLNFAGATDLKRAAGNSDNSRIYNALSSSSRTHMPPRSAPQPSADDIAMIKQWIDQGANISADYPVIPPPSTASSNAGPGNDD